MSERVESVVEIAPGGPAPRCGDCGRFFRAHRAVMVEVWATAPTPEPMGGDLYCPACRPVEEQP